MARTFAPEWIEASTLSVPTNAMSALPESKTRIAFESPVTTTSSTSRSPSQPFFCATYKGSENVVAGPGKAILILAANAWLASSQASAIHIPSAIFVRRIPERQQKKNDIADLRHWLGGSNGGLYRIIAEPVSEISSQRPTVLLAADGSGHNILGCLRISETGV